jgi:hypothetical protein
MRKAAGIAAAVFGLLAITATLVTAQSTTSAVSYSIGERGAESFQTAGGANAMAIGYGRVQPSASTTPSGVAIYGLTQNGVLVTEAGVPGVMAISSGRTYAEVNGVINTGIAFANTNAFAVTVSYFFTDQFGNNIRQAAFTLNASVQTAVFISDAPFNVANGFVGTFTFTASAPIGVIALRTLVNERSEFIATTQAVTPLPDTTSAGALVIAHFADGGGWKTQVILVNTTDVAVSGSVQFFGEGTATVAASPVTLNVNGQVSATFNYTIKARSSLNLQTSGVGVAAQVGSVKISPATGSTSPSAFVIFSFSNNGVTVSESTVQAQPAGNTFRSYVEINSRPALPGSIQSAVAIANNSSTAAFVTFELSGMNGVSTGLTATATVPAFGHISKFVHELFPTLAVPFQGVLRVSSSNSIEIVSLRGRYNERGDFLITTTPASNEAAPSSTAELIFPHFVDGGGYTTQFVLFSGINGQVSIGTLRFFGQSGQAINLTFR